MGGGAGTSVSQLYHLWNGRTPFNPQIKQSTRTTRRGIGYTSFYNFIVNNGVCDNIVLQHGDFEEMVFFGVNYF